MLRSDREVTSRAGIAEIIAACDCCRVGFADAGGVYIVPMNFAYMDNGALGALYFHGAKEGRKAGLIAARPEVGIVGHFDLLTKFDEQRGFFNENSPRYRHAAERAMEKLVKAVLAYDNGEKLDSIDERIVSFISDNYRNAYQYQAEGKSEAEKLYLRLLLVTDYVCGMTDSYAKRLYQEMKGII